MNKTLYLYSRLEYFIDYSNVIEKKYRKNFMKKILCLSDGKIEQIINILEKSEEKIKNIKYKGYLKNLIVENKFLKKVINYNKYLIKIEEIDKMEKLEVK